MAKTNKTPKAEDNAELRTISLLKILNTYSDENHELSTKNIMDKLQKECGVTVHRTTVGKNIKQLADCGFDIYTHKTTQNRYYLASRLFEMPELKLLADAVESAGFITEKKSEELIEKLCRLTSVYEAEALQEGFCANNGKSCNESIYYIYCGHDQRGHCEAEENCVLLFSLRSGQEPCAEKRREAVCFQPI